MFKNLLIYRIADGWEPVLTDAILGLERQQFQPCEPTQERSAGWLPSMASWVRTGVTTSGKDFLSVSAFCVLTGC